MTGTSSSYHTRVSNEIRRRYQYECNNAKRTHSCHTKKISKELIEGIVIDQLTQNLLIDSIIPALTEKVHNFYCQNNNLDKDVKLWTKQIKELDRKINNLADVITNGGNGIRSLVDKLRILETERSETHLRINELKAQTPHNITQEMIFEYLTKHKNKLLSQNPEVSKRVVEEFVEYVKINKDTVNIMG